MQLSTRLIFFYTHISLKMHNRLDPIIELQSVILGDIFMLDQYEY